MKQDSISVLGQGSLPDLRVRRYFRGSILDRSVLHWTIDHELRLHHELVRARPLGEQALSYVGQPLGE